jgi:D-aspartate ligase
VFIKALDVTEWRKKVDGTVKGYMAGDEAEFHQIVSDILPKKVTLLVQEMIIGPDTNHYKYCAYFSREGEPLLQFTLRKIRQNPIRFGVGSVVESLHYPELLEEGRNLFKAIGYKGVGSAEFKLDQHDNRLKLIEINPRYWQQNSLGEAVGMNFPLMNYLELTGQKPAPVVDFKTGIKWVNIYMDFDSFLAYRKEKSLTLREWLKSLGGVKTWSDMAWDDILPGFYEIRFGARLFRIPWYFIKKIFH